MLPTEVQRIVLLIGLAATAYLMMLAWNQDYGQGSDLPPYSVEPDFSTLPGTPNAVGELPVLPGPGGSDVPDPSLIGSMPAPAAAVTPSAPDAQPPEQRLIRVNTPMLNVWIDRLGGDIVRVALPPHLLSLDRPDLPFLLLNEEGGVYVAQSGMIGTDGIDAGAERPLYRAAQSEYTLAVADGAMTVELVAETAEQRVTKRFEFAADDYLVNVAFELENRSDRPLTAGLFAQIKRDDREPFGDKPMFLGPRPFLGAAFTTVETRYKRLDFNELGKGTFRATVDGGWVAFLQHYFLSAWIGNPEETNSFFGQSRPDGTYVVGYIGPQRVVPVGASAEWTSRFYVGPKDQKRLGEIAPNLNLTVDYGFLWWLAVPLFYLLDGFHALVGNWAGAIILLTLLVKLVLYPLSAASYRSMANMRRVAPQMKRLQERYADDRQKLSQEMMALYKKEKVNPLGGCLPMLLPMPIFIALYWVLFESVELRHAPFMLWIRDLSAMDPFFVLPLLMGASMYLQQLMSPAIGDPMQQRMMRLMPIMFTVLFLFFPAGLVLYWLVNNLLSLAQQWYVMKQTEEAYAAKS
jgi:YidC/Oxa1 family membrane protein insertase